MTQMFQYTRLMIWTIFITMGTLVISFYWTLEGQRATRTLTLLLPLDTRDEAQEMIGLERMVAMAEEAVGQAPVHLAVAHALDRPLAENLLAQAQARLNCRESSVTDLALSLAVHFGPGAVGFATTGWRHAC